MKWWHILVLVVDLYLIISLGPWILFQIVNWLLLGSGQFLVYEKKRLQELTDAEQAQVAAWPVDVRPGRYEQPDLVARENLAGLQEHNMKARGLMPALATYAPVRLSFGQVVSLRSWGPLVKVLALWHDLNTLRGLLQRSDDTLFALQEQQVIVQDIPHRVRAALNEARAEVRRLDAILDAEQQAGTVGLDEQAQRLQTMRLEIEQALDALAQAEEAELPAVTYEIDASLNLITPTLEEIEHLLDSAAAERNRAQDLVDRVTSTLALAEERWEALKGRGATEPLIARALAKLQVEATQIAGLTQQRTLNAYQMVNERVSTLDEANAWLMERLDTLDEAMRRSKDAIAGDVQALAESQRICTELTRQEPLLDADLSLALVERATAAYSEAERQRGLGTIEGYQTAIERAQQALNLLGQSQEVSQATLEKTEQVRSLLADLSAEALGEWRGRADRVREQLQLYPKHWGTAIAGDAGEAISSLDQVELDLERIPANVRYQRRFRQSELNEAIDTLSHAHQSLDRAAELVDKLETEWQRIEGQRETLEQAVCRLDEQTFPTMDALAEQMLPELQGRYQSLKEAYKKRAALLKDASQTQYDEATDEWLPSILRQLEEIRGVHEGDVRHYQELLRDAVHRLDKQWTRLTKLSPHEQPGPEEDVNRLSDDLAAWRSQVEHQGENPNVLRELVGRRVAALEARIETAQQQITEGRNTMEGLDRQYRRRAQAVRTLRNTVRELQNGNVWSGITWDFDEPDGAWEQAIALERDSRSAPTLIRANDQLQQAINAAQQAEQMYARLKHEMDTVLGRLNGEMAALRASLERGERRMAELREAGPSEILTALEEQCASAQRAIETAQQAKTFEDALHYLREARNILTRL